MNHLITITNKAANQIKKILSKAPDNVDSIVVGVDNSGCSGYSYKIDFAISSNLENYDKIEKNGVMVLIDPKATMYLLGSKMDYKSDKLSSKFVFDNPNEKSTCGCGESFNI